MSWAGGGARPRALTLTETAEMIRNTAEIVRDAAGGAVRKLEELLERLEGGGAGADELRRLAEGALDLASKCQEYAGGLLDVAEGRAFALFEEGDHRCLLCGRRGAGTAFMRFKTGAGHGIVVVVLLCASCARERDEEAREAIRQLIGAEGETE